MGIDWYINESLNIEISAEGFYKKCYIIEDKALLLYKSSISSALRLKSNIEGLISNGVNVPRVLEISQHPDFLEYLYILEEKAPGNIVHSYDKAASYDDYINRLIILKKADTHHYIKFVGDWLKILELGGRVDYGKGDNFFYDTEAGFTFIDLEYFYSPRYIINYREKYNFIRELILVLINKNLYFSGRFSAAERESIDNNIGGIITKLEDGLLENDISENILRDVIYDMFSYDFTENYDISYRSVLE